MNARAVLRRLATAIARDRELPIAALARKLASNAVAVASARMRLRGCDAVGPRARAFGRPFVENAGRITVGEDFAVSSRFGAVSLVTREGAEIAIGDGVTINYGTCIRAAKHVTIGDDAKIGPFCVISDADVDDDAAPIEIAAGAWLATRVVVRPGVRIGKGAVVAAGSVVEEDVPDHAIASGAPARVLRVRGAVAPPPDSMVRARDLDAASAARKAPRVA